jgi:hypothetical protein
MIKAKRLIPLAVLAEQPVMLDGYGEIPPVTNWIKTMSAPLNYFGVWLPKDAPAEVHAAFGKVWQEKISKSAALADYARRRAALFTPLQGDAATAEGMKAVRQIAWLYWDAGKGKVSPDSVGIPRT